VSLIPSHALLYVLSSLMALSCRIDSMQDATLSSIVPSCTGPPLVNLDADECCQLYPPFDPLILDYTCSISYRVESLSLAYQDNSLGGVGYANKSRNLLDTGYVPRITTTSRDGSRTKTYSIYVVLEKGIS
jgi:hypothetical protein